MTDFYDKEAAFQDNKSVIFTDHNHYKGVQFRIVADVDKKVYACYVRDKKGNLPREATHVSPTYAAAIYYGKNGRPHPQENEIIKQRKEELLKNKENSS